MKTDVKFLLQCNISSTDMHQNNQIYIWIKNEF